MSDSETTGVTGVHVPIGAEVDCGGERCGEVSRVVIDPLVRRLTHLVVNLKDDASRIVPLELVAQVGERVRLSCTPAELHALDPAVEIHFLDDPGPFPGYGAGETLVWPYYGLGTALDPAGIGAGGPLGPAAVVADRIPLGEVELRRGDSVRALDGDVGRVQGLVIDSADDHVTHVLLEEGHLWGKKQVAIPIAAVTGLDADGAHVSLTTRQIRELPPVEIAPPHESGDR